MDDLRHSLLGLTVLGMHISILGHSGGEGMALSRERDEFLRQLGFEPPA